MAVKRLRKGLDEIFGENIDSVLNDIQSNASAKDSTKVKLSEIRPNPYQPRKTFDKVALEELAASIKEHGVFTPVLLKKSLSGYELIAGERRCRASKLAGLQEVPAIIVDFNDQQMMEISLLENIQREDLSPLEEARAYESLLNKINYTQEKLAERVGKSRTYVANTMRLLKLPIKVQDLLNKGKLTYGHARALLSIEDEDKMMELADRCVNENLTVRDIERLAKESKKPSSKPVKEKNPYMTDLQNRIEEKLSTKVEVENKKIVIHYNDTTQLNEILEKLGLID